MTTGLPLICAVASLTRRPVPSVLEWKIGQPRRILPYMRLKLVTCYVLEYALPVVWLLSSMPERWLEPSIMKRHRLQSEFSVYINIKIKLKQSYSFGFSSSIRYQPMQSPNHKCPLAMLFSKFRFFIPRFRIINLNVHAAQCETIS